MSRRVKEKFSDQIKDTDFKMERFWEHAKPTISKKKYSRKEIETKKRFNFGEDND